MSDKPYPVYAPPTELLSVAPTKAEHDAQVARRGRPYTQPQWDQLGRKPAEHRPTQGDR